MPNALEQNELATNYGNDPNPDLPSEPDSDSIRRNNELGAKILAKVGFDRHNQSAVGPSFNLALKHGEKLSGKNNERRIYAYLSRLDRLIKRQGNKIERLLWLESIKDGLLIEEENITEAIWETHRQNLRDNGAGAVELTDRLKHERIMA